MVSGNVHSSHDDDDSSVVDFAGNPPDKSRTGGWLAAGLILGSELSERVCVMGISMNLVTYLVGDLHLSTSKSANIVTNFMGTLNLVALFAGFMADAKLGRFLTVAISASVTAAGTILLTLATSLGSMRPPPCTDFRKRHHDCTPANSGQLALLYAALYTIALGGGGIKSSVSGFGSDQFNIRDPKEEKAMIFFFNRFYFCISLGSLFSVTFLVYIQDNVGRGWGYGISAVTMVIAVVVLLACSRLYRFRKAKGSPLTVIANVIYFAWKKRSLPHPSHPSVLHEYHISKVQHTEKYRCLDKAAIVATSEAVKCSTMTQVEEVKMIIRLLPIWSTCILFWTVYSQMTTFSVEQATYMDRNLGFFIFPSGSLSFFLFISILLFTSLNEKLLVPFARKFTHNVQGVTSLQRVGVGLVLSMVAMATAAIVEKERRKHAVEKNTKISVFWLVPQYFLVGAGEAFAYVGQLEFFIREAPSRMKSMSTGLFLSTLAMGFFVSSLLVSLVNEATNHSWIKNNMNKGKLDYFYWMLVILGVFNFLVFLLFAKKHDYKHHVYDGEETMKENSVDGSIVLEEEMIKIEGGGL